MDGWPEAGRGLPAGRCGLSTGPCPLDGKEPEARGDCEAFAPTLPGRGRCLSGSFTAWSPSPLSGMSPAVTVSCAHGPWALPEPPSSDSLGCGAGTGRDLGPGTSSWLWFCRGTHQVLRAGGWVLMTPSLSGALGLP